MTHRGIDCAKGWQVFATSYLIRMNLFGLYLFAAFTTVVLFVGWEIRRHSSRQRLRQQRIVESTVIFENENSPFEPSSAKAGTSALSWFHIAPQRKKGQWVQVKGWLDVDTPFSFQLEACDHQSLKVCMLQCGSQLAQFDASSNGLMKLLPGMFAIIQRDEKGHYMLAAGASHTPVERDFFQQQDAICAIENHFPKRHCPELRLFYRFEPPTFEFCDPHCELLPEVSPREGDTLVAHV